MMHHHQDFHWVDNGTTEQSMKSAIFEKHSAVGFVTLFVDDLAPVSYQVRSKIKIKLSLSFLHQLSDHTYNASPVTQTVMFEPHTQHSVPSITQQNVDSVSEQQQSIHSITQQNVDSVTEQNQSIHSDIEQNAEPETVTMTMGSVMVMVPQHDRPTHGHDNNSVMTTKIDAEQNKQSNKQSIHSDSRDRDSPEEAEVQEDKLSLSINEHCEQVTVDSESMMMSNSSCVSRHHTVDTKAQERTLLSKSTEQVVNTVTKDLGGQRDNIAKTNAKEEIKLLSNEQVVYPESVDSSVLGKQTEDSNAQKKDINASTSTASDRDSLPSSKVKVERSATSDLLRQSSRRKHSSKSSVTSNAKKARKRKREKTTVEKKIHVKSKSKSKKMRHSVIDDLESRYLRGRKDGKNKTDSDMGTNYQQKCPDDANSISRKIVVEKSKLSTKKQTVDSDLSMDSDGMTSDGENIDISGSESTIRKSLPKLKRSKTLKVALISKTNSRLKKKATVIIQSKEKTKKRKKSRKARKEPSYESEDPDSEHLEGKKNTGAEATVEKSDSDQSIDADKSCRCLFCLQEFDNKQALYDHRKVPNNKTYTCEVCYKEFPYLAYYEIHKKLECNKIITNYENKITEQSCEKCDARPKGVYNLKRHNMVHTKEFFSQCCVCKEMFVDPTAFTKHMKRHRSGGMVRCTCCDKLFPTRSALSLHRLSVLEIKCHLCGKIFPNKTSRSEHYKYDHQKDILRCSKCTLLFSSQKDLNEHMERHTKHKKKQCPTCGKYFSRLVQHLLTHKKASLKTPDDHKSYQCDNCPEKFKHPATLHRHVHRMHSTERPYQCPECPMAFSDSGVLRKHLKKHSPICPYTCEICGHKFKELGDKSVHMKIHSDIRPFTCPKCSKTFSYKSSLQSHLKFQHTTSLLRTVSLKPTVTQTSNVICNFDHSKVQGTTSLLCTMSLKPTVTVTQTSNVHSQGPAICNSDYSKVQGTTSLLTTPSFKPTVAAQASNTQIQDPAVCNTNLVKFEHNGTTSLLTIPTATSTTTASFNECKPKSTVAQTPPNSQGQDPAICNTNNLTGQKTDTDTKLNSKTKKSISTLPMKNLLAFK